jgi:hypothetical protein
MGCGTLIALGLAGAGAGLGYAGEQQSKNAMNNSINAELGRQQGFTKQAQGVFNQSLGQSTPQAAQQQIGQGTQQALQTIGRAQNVPAAFSMPSFGATNTGQQQAKMDLSNQASAGMQGYGEYTLDQALKDMQARSQLGVISNEAASSAAVNPYEIQAASQRGAPLQAAGSLLGTLGTLGGIYGMLGKGPQMPAQNYATANALPVSGSSQAPFYQQYGNFGNMWPYSQMTNNMLGFGG